MNAEKRPQRISAKKSISKIDRNKSCLSVASSFISNP
jgi:hypothetical protein